MRARTLAARAAISALVYFGSARAWSQTYTYETLHSFNGGSEGSQASGLLRDGAGNLYGTTVIGGAIGHSRGTIFKIGPTGEETVLYDFTGGADGANPSGPLVMDAEGNLYGTTTEGGDLSESNTGFGVVFKIDPFSQMTTLYAFTGGLDGGRPEWGVVLDEAGNLYGTTYEGGLKCPFAVDFGCGVIFKINAAGGETVVHEFTGGEDGAVPSGGLVLDSSGNLYGTNTLGARAYGSVFEITPTGGSIALYNFSEDATPSNGVVLSSTGHLYGTASGGGMGLYGSVYFLIPGGEFGKLHKFTGGADGSGPGPLLVTASGVVYGATARGGGSEDVCPDGCGVVFELLATNETVVYTFTGNPNGAFPKTGVIRDASGNLYGTTFGGGSASGSYGVVFKLNYSQQ